MSDSASVLSAINQLRLILIPCQTLWSLAEKYNPPDVSFFPDAGHEQTESFAWQLLMMDRPPIAFKRGPDAPIVGALKRLAELAESGACEELRALSAWDFAHKLGQVLQLTPQADPSSSGKAARLWRCQWTSVAKTIQDWGDEPRWGRMQGELDEKERRLKGELSPAPIVLPAPRAAAKNGGANVQNSPPPLTEHEKSVLDIIKAQAEGKGVSGKEIIAILAKRGDAPEQSTLTRHIIPKLKKWFGVKNAGGGRGYYIPPA